VSKLSIITVVKNDATALQNTLDSIQLQNYKDFEHIIIDGKSNDNTINVLKEFSAYPIQTISEQDNGVYDAMNKGLVLAKSQWLLFLNAGDLFVDQNALGSWMQNCRDEYDFIYCDVYRAQDNQSKKLWVQKSPIEYKWYRNICHQALLYNRQKLGSFRYDTSYAISADFHLLLKILTQRSNLSYLKIEKVFLEYKIGGISQKYAMKALNERWKSFDSLIENKLLKVWNYLNLSRQILRQFLTQCSQ